MSSKMAFTVLSIFFSLEVFNYIGLAASTLAQQARPAKCVQGYVWREAFAGDFVCVLPKTRSQAAFDNGQVAARIDPLNYTYGPDTCIQGYVWREANPYDHVCVLGVATGYV